MHHNYTTTQRRRATVPTASAAVRVNRSAAGGPGTLTGYASVFHRAGDPGTQYTLASGPGYKVVERIMPGAFDRALRERDDVVALVNHDANLVIGRVPGTLSLSVDRVGLRYSITLPDSPNGRNIAEAVRRGDITGSSFSFIPDEVSYAEEGDLDIVEVRSVRLFDVGPVTYPAYGATSVSASGDGAGRSARPARPPGVGSYLHKAKNRLCEIMREMP